MSKDDHEKSKRQRRFSTIPQFAEKLRVSERKIWREIEGGKLKVHRFGNSTRISDEDGDDYIDRSKE